MKHFEKVVTITGEQLKQLNAGNWEDFAIDCIRKGLKSCGLDLRGHKGPFKKNDEYTLVLDVKNTAEKQED